MDLYYSIGYFIFIMYMEGIMGTSENGLDEFNEANKNNELSTLNKLLKGGEEDHRYKRRRELIKERFKIFRESIDKWMLFFHMSDWKYMVHLDEEYETYWATTRVTYMDNNMVGCNHIVNFSVSEDWLTDRHICNEEEIDKCAFHEVMELMLIKLRTWSTTLGIGISGRECDDEVHRIIRRMENLVYPIINGNSGG